MKNYLSREYIRQILIWFWSGKYYIMTISVVTFTILCIQYGDNLYQKMVSNLMIIIGLIILFNIQRKDLQRYSNFKSKTFTNWIESFPENINVVLEPANISTSSKIGKPYLYQEIPRDSSVEKKIDFLLDESIKIHESIAILHSHVDGLVDLQIDNEKKNSLEIKKLDSSVKKLIAGHVVGDYDINFFGLMITFCGTLIQIFA